MSANTRSINLTFINASRPALRGHWQKKGKLSLFSIFLAFAASTHTHTCMSHLKKLLDSDDLLLLFVRTSSMNQYLTRMLLTRGLGATCKSLHAFIKKAGSHSEAYAYLEQRVRVTKELVEQMQAYCMQEYEDWATTVHVEWSRHSILIDNDHDRNERHDGWTYRLTVRSRGNHFWRVLDVKLFVDTNSLFFCFFSASTPHVHLIEHVEDEMDETPSQETTRKCNQLEVFMYLPHYPSITFEVFVDNGERGVLRHQSRKPYSNGLWKALFERRFLPRWL